MCTEERMAPRRGDSPARKLMAGQKIIEKAIATRLSSARRLQLQVYPPDTHQAGTALSTTVLHSSPK
eukprot:scaffold21832_cov62-Phaeocystis_antarctica.AAC.11